MPQHIYAGHRIDLWLKGDFDLKFRSMKSHRCVCAHAKSIHKKFQGTFIVWVMCGTTFCLVKDGIGQTGKQTRA